VDWSYAEGETHVRFLLARLGICFIATDFSGDAQVCDHVQLQRPTHQSDQNLALKITAIFWKERWIIDESSNGTDWWEWPFGYYWKSADGAAPFPQLL